MELKTYQIRATKRGTGEIIEGVTKWDGLASLHPVLTKSGETRYVSVLDNITKFERVN